MSVPEAALLEEVSALRKKVVALETAETDNEKLRKELNKLRVAALEQKSTLELEFMNQLTGVARENALKLEELEGRLEASKNINVALNEKIRLSPSAESMNQHIVALEAQHRKDLAQTIDANNLEIQRTRQQLYMVMASRDKLVEDFEEAKSNLSKKDKEIEMLKDKERASADTIGDEENARRFRLLQTSRDALSRELQNAKAILASKDAEIDSLKQQLQKTVEASKVQLEATKSEVASLKLAKQTLEIELKKASTSMKLTQAKLNSSYGAQAAMDNGKVKDYEATIRNLTGELEQCKSNLASAEYELDRFKSNVSVSETPLEKRLEERQKENMELRARIERQEKASAQQQSEAKAMKEESARLKQNIQRINAEVVAQKQEVERLHRAKKDLAEKYEHEIRILRQRVPARNKESKKIVASASMPQSLKIENTKTKEILAYSRGIAAIQSPTEGQMQPKTLFGRHLDSDAELAKIKQTPGSTESEKKTTLIIRRLEENLKKEGNAKQAKAAGLKALSTSDRDDRAEMQKEISSLHQTLDAERNQTNTLREEISKLTATAPSVRERKSSLLNSAPSTPNRTKSSVDETLPRTPVRGLVVDYEMKISSLGAKRVEAGSSSVMDFDDLDALRGALRYERQQVIDLEAELTRQCEMNCTLLKEISWLTRETENSRSRGTTAMLDTGKGFERNKIERLACEVSDLKQELKNVMDEKAHYANQVERIADSNRREMDRLTSELSAAKSRLAKAEAAALPPSRLPSSLSSDHKEVDHLKLQVRQLETKLNESQRECEQLERISSSEKSGFEALQRKLSSFEDQQLEVSELKLELDWLKSQTSRFKELENELASLQIMKSDHVSCGDEIAGLRSLVERLEEKVSELEATKASLLKENETTTEIDSTIENLRSDLKAAEARVQVLSDQLAQKELAQDESKTRLMNQAESLAKDLQKVSEQRDEIEMNCRINHTGKFESLTDKVNSLTTELERVSEERDQAHEQNRIHNDIFDSLRDEIDGKVELFERTHAADKQEISRLQTQVASMEKKLEESLSTLENFRMSSKNREELEEAIENNGQSGNEHSSQIETLQKELTLVRFSETEKEQKLKMLAKAMESMEAEFQTTSASKDTLVDEMKQTLAEKHAMIDRLSNENEQLVLSIKDMTTSRRDEIDALRNELMEMSTRAANQAREIQTLKVQLEESEYRKEEMDRLRKRVRDLSEQVANNHGANSADDDRAEKLQLENTALRQRLRDVNLALKRAEEKMRETVSHQTSSKAMQSLRDRNVTLKFEVEKLTRQLRKLAERKQQHQEDINRTDSGDRDAPSVRYSHGSEHVAAAASDKALTRFMI
jgi:hypothetical protein